MWYMHAVRARRRRKGPRFSRSAKVGGYGESRRTGSCGVQLARRLERDDRLMPVERRWSI